MILTNDELSEALDLSLWAGRLLLQFGAETDKVEQAVHNVGKALGCDTLSSIITHNSIILTMTSGNEFRTKIIKVLRQGVNYEIVSQVGKLSYAAYKHNLDAPQVHAALQIIEDTPPNYGKFFTLFMVALACASFSILFGGGIAVFFITFIAAFIGAFIRNILIKKQFNIFFIQIVSAFFAVAVSGLGLFFTDSPEIIFASSVLFLIPGVQLINSAEDLIKGHFVVGFTRGFVGILLSLSIAFGITFGLLFLRGAM